MQTSQFAGPLFIVGRPRSGTKLLRTLLNEHPKIGIPISETNFFHSMVAHFGNPPPFHFEEKFKEFYRKFSETIFFDWRKKHNVVLTKDELRKRADLTSWSSIFETILKYYASKKIKNGVIWGDKSPRYLTEMPLIKSLFPEAKFLHIIRDPRDHCLSVKKAWGHNLYRTAYVWQQDVEAARMVGQLLGSDYKEVLFESVLSNPEDALRDICCNYLGIEFIPDMVNLSVSHEDRGDAKGELRIVSDNTKKYNAQLTPAVIKRIEEIVYPTTLAVGYELEYADRFNPLNPMESKLLKVQDGFALTKFYMQDKGIIWGAKYFFRSLFR